MVTQSAYSGGNEFLPLDSLNYWYWKFGALFLLLNLWTNHSFPAFLSTLVMWGSIL